MIMVIALSAVAYLIGLRRGLETSKNFYDEGWLACEQYFNTHFELTPIDEMLDGVYEELTREQKARVLIDELDDLFQDVDMGDEEIVDGGEY